MGFTANEAGMIGGVSQSHVTKLINEGKLKAKKVYNTPGGTYHWDIEMSREEIARAVDEHTKRAVEPKTKVNGGGPRETLSAKLEGVGEWLTVEKEKRASLIRLAKLYSVEELELLEKL
jgi:hypothetical protein